MREGTRQHDMTAPAALCLLAAFAASILLVLLTGAGAYRRLADRDARAFQSRTAAQYLATRVRQSDGADGVRVEDFGGVSALTMTEGDGYITRVYCYDGGLWELYAPAGLDMAPSDGERVLDLGGMELTLEDGLLEAVLTQTDGSAQTVTLSLRGGEVAE